ncbi:sugar ABC transporter permease [Paenibacillus swuensis]|uniref:Sugar ABC transporter permease n=1 Tax=Paenibacillus swuensis TaxID=1178515 RepID=A0A172TFP4_9BACL|nr:carbohydrate ABC transporter permease [Paenibacillus swuensis]ANE45724.1 sugar ABC transporter permease [Paenibacillus swuensis]
MLRKLGIWGTIAIIAVLQIFPLLWLFNFSFLPSSEFFGSSILKWPDPFHWKNYSDALTHGKVPQFFLNSVLVTAVTIVMTTLISIFMAYAFTRMYWKWRGVVLGIILIGMIIPVQTTLLANFLIFKNIGLLDTYWSLILPGIAFNIPISTFILTGFLVSLPREMEEVAVIDGLNIFGLVMKVVIPLCKPAIAAISVMVFLASWSDYINPLTFISSESLKTLPFSIIQFQGQYSSNYGAQFAVLTLISIPSVAIYLLFSEQITKGIMAGAVKG